MIVGSGKGADVMLEPGLTVVDADVADGTAQALLLDDRYRQVLRTGRGQDAATVAPGLLLVGLVLLDAHPAAVRDGEEILHRRQIRRSQDRTVEKRRHQRIMPRWELSMKERILSRWSLGSNSSRIWRQASDTFKPLL